ncbi:MAG: hypothetical protein IKV85_11295 [Ruminococcus sp.]|nr:hypothetical protein [Ruminococcus sp.]
MKYIVMQCCKGYAVLMDEEGKYVFAANMNYETGQTVTNPIIMSDNHKQRKPVITIIKTVAAAAACIGIISIPCYSYYNRNLKPCSTVTLASDTSISMTLNSSGKVIGIESDNEYGKKIIEKVDIKGKDNAEAANEIVQAEITEGYIAAGDTVNVYIDGNSQKNYEDIKAKLEKELPKHDIKVNIHDEKHPPTEDNKGKKEDKLPHEKPVAPEVTADVSTKADKKPAPPTETKPVMTPAPPVHEETPEHETPLKPVETPVPPVQTEEADIHEKTDKHEPPAPPHKEKISGDILTEPPLSPVVNHPDNGKPLSELPL